jgi:hypothetical protein
MNKYCSLLIIVLIIYLTYDYCSNIVEGNDTVAGGGTYDESKDNYSGVECIYAGKRISGITKISDGVKDKKDYDVTNPCDYKDVSCVNTIPDVKEWGNMFTSIPDDSSEDKSNRLKKQCQLCVIGSKVDGSTVNALANVSTKSYDIPVKPISNFAYDMCDAMVADCDKSIFYANNKQDGWGIDCSHVDDADSTWVNNKLNKLLCKTLTSSVLQFFLGFMGGIECTMLIKGYEFKGYINKKIDDFGAHPGDTLKKGAHFVSGGII